MAQGWVDTKEPSVCRACTIIMMVEFQKWNVCLWATMELDLVISDEKAGYACIFRGGACCVHMCLHALGVEGLGGPRLLPPF